MKRSRAGGGARIDMILAWGLECDRLTLQCTLVSSWWPCHQISCHLLLMWRSSALQHHGGRGVMVNSGIVAGVGSRGYTLSWLLLPQSHVTKLGVEGIRLEIKLNQKNSFC